VETFQHNYSLESADFAPDPTLLVTSGGWGQTQLWHIPTGLPLGPPVPGEFEPEPTFADDGRLVTMFRGQARLWNLQPWTGSDAEKMADSP